jgi:hypothetical protein
MENKIEQIIAKLRDMYKYTNEYKELFNSDARVILVVKNGSFDIKEIIFGTYDKISVNNKRVFYEPEFGFTKVLIEYNGFDELLKV